LNTQTKLAMLGCAKTLPAGVDPRGRLGRSLPLKPTKVTFSPWFCTMRKTAFAI